MSRRVASAVAYKAQDKSIRTKVDLPSTDKSNVALWETYHTSPEVHFIISTVRNTISRVKFLPVDKKGRSLRDQNGDPVEGISPELIDASEKILERLKGASGGQSQLIGALAGCLALASDGWLLGYIGDPTTGEPNQQGEEIWATLSRDKIHNEGNGIKIKFSSSKEAKEILGPMKLIRFWQPALDAPDKADSWVTPLLRVIELLKETYEALGAVTLSQINAGIIVVPSEQDATPIGVEKAIDLHSDPESGESIKEDFAQTLADEVADFIEGAAKTVNGSYRVAPLVVPIDSDGRNLEWIEISRGIDANISKTIEDLRYQIAVGCPYPTETLLGQNQSKFYQGVHNVDRVDQETFRHIYEPICELIADGIKRYVLWEYLAEYFDPEEYEQIEIGWDNSKIVSPADNCEKAIKLYSLNPPGITIEELRVDCGKDPQPEGQLLDPNQQNNSQDTQNPQDQPVVAKASIGPNTKTLASIAQSYMDKLGLICDQTVLRMQERAGSRLISLANHPDLKPLQDTMRTISVENIGILPGVAKFAKEKGETDQSLFGKALSKLEDQYRRLTLASLKERNDLIKEETDQVIESRDDEVYIAAGWAILSAGLLDLAKKRFFTSTTEELLSPEKPLAHSMPVDLLRKVSATIGGADAEQDDMSSISTGPITLAAYSRAGYSLEGYLWVYGDPATRITPYEPHVALSGHLAGISMKEFGSNRPKDHAWCQCILEPRFKK